MNILTLDLVLPRALPLLARLGLMTIHKNIVRSRNIVVLLVMTNSVCPSSLNVYKRTEELACDINWLPIFSIYFNLLPSSACLASTYIDWAILLKFSIAKFDLAKYVTTITFIKYKPSWFIFAGYFLFKLFIKKI